jgi:hypothetical protein
LWLILCIKTNHSSQTFSPQIPITIEMPHPADFPQLPDTPNDFQWGANVLQAHDIITAAYSQANSLLHQEGVGPIRICVDADKIANRIAPILEALEPEVGDQPWVTQCAESLGHLMADLVRAATTTDTMYGRCKSQFSALIIPQGIIEHYPRQPNPY